MLALTIRSLLRTLSGAVVAAVPLEEHLVISRPVRGALVTHILGLVVLGGLTIGSMVASGLLLFGPQR
jgi:hypothetical protein